MASSTSISIRKLYEGENRPYGLKLYASEIVGSVEKALGAGAAAAASATMHTVGLGSAEAMPVVFVNALPILAIIQGLCSIVHGVFSFLDKNHLAQVKFPPAKMVLMGNDQEHDVHGTSAPVRNRARGIFEIVSGAYLVEGGIESTAQTFCGADISLGIGELYLRFAVYALSQFVLALGDLHSYYKLSKQHRDQSILWDVFWYKAVSTMVATALMATGWILAVADGVVDIKSCLFFASATIVFAGTCYYSLTKAIMSSDSPISYKNTADFNASRSEMRDDQPSVAQGSESRSFNGFF